MRLLLFIAFPEALTLVFTSAGEPRSPTKSKSLRDVSGASASTFKGVEEINAAPVVHRWRKFDALTPELAQRWHERTMRVT